MLGRSLTAAVTPRRLVAWRRSAGTAPGEAAAARHAAPCTITNSTRPSLPPSHWPV